MHERRHSLKTVICAGTICACRAAVSCLASSSRSPSSARPASSVCSIRATSVSVVTAGCNSAISFTRYTNFATGSPSSREPRNYPSRTKPHRFACSRPQQWGHANQRSCAAPPSEKRSALSRGGTGHTAAKEVSQPDSSVALDHAAVHPAIGLGVTDLEPSAWRLPEHPQLLAPGLDAQDLTLRCDPDVAGLAHDDRAGRRGGRGRRLPRRRVNIAFLSGVMPA